MKFAEPAALQRRNLLKGGAVAAGSLLLPAWARADDYPSRPITFICPWPAGGTADQSMRSICQVASRRAEAAGRAGQPRRRRRA